MPQPCRLQLLARHAIHPIVPITITTPPTSIGIAPSLIRPVSRHNMKEVSGAPVPRTLLNLASTVPTASRNAPMTFAACSGV